jgi:hypothetical protein
LRIKEQETRLNLHEHDDDDDDEIINGITSHHMKIFSEHKPVSDHNRNAVDWTFTKKGMDLIHGEPGHISTVDLKNLISKP